MPMRQRRDGRVHEPRKLLQCLALELRDVWDAINLFLDRQRLRPRRHQLLAPLALTVGGTSAGFVAFARGIPRQFLGMKLRLQRASNSIVLFWRNNFGDSGIRRWHP